MSDKCPQNFVQVVGQMYVSDKCPCRTNVRLPCISLYHINLVKVVFFGCMTYANVNGRLSASIYLISKS